MKTQKIKAKDLMPGYKIYDLEGNPGPVIRSIVTGNEAVFATRDDNGKVIVMHEDDEVSVELKG